MLMSEQEFFDLGIQVIAGRATPEDTAALDAELARRPELKAELDRLREVSAVADEVVQLAQAMENSTAAELPGYARRQLQESLKKTFPTPVSSTTLRERLQDLMHRWRWVLGATAAAIAIALFVVLPHMNNPPKPMIQLAMLDSVGQTRGATGSWPTDAEIAITLKASLGQTNLTIFSEMPDLKNWLEQGLDDKKLLVIKIWYDRDAHKIRVQSRRNNIIQLEKVFPVEKESDLPIVLKEAVESLEQKSRIPTKYNQ